MSVKIDFKIDVTEPFPRLSKAPIVEAVISVQARASSVWDEQTVLEAIKPKLPDYPSIFKIRPGHTTKTTFEGSIWTGTRFFSADDKYIAQFNQDGFVVSRLHPYEGWERFSSEAMRLLPLFLETARPLEVHQLALRYVNRIDLPPEDIRFEEYIDPTPKPPNKLDLPFSNFFHQDKFAVPGHDYAISIIRTIQRTPDSLAQGFGIILDITVSTWKPFDLRQDLVEHRLAEMRCLKNRAFFGSITEKTLKSLQGLSK
jgi:uncharacterized protein (TIGR04255 family)